MNRSDREILASLMNAQAIELSAAGAVALAKGLRRRARRVADDVRASMETWGAAPRPALVRVARETRR